MYKRFTIIYVFTNVCVNAYVNAYVYKYLNSK